VADFRDQVKCACPRIGGLDCARSRNRIIEDGGGFDSFDAEECPCRCHDLLAELERDIEDEQDDQWEADRG
jgi:hypothetical protein